LKMVFGFDAFRAGQETVINKIINGKSALAVFPTGSGKSLCYQLSALHLDGLTVVVSPLIALMKDQVDFLRQHDIPAARLDSSITLEEIRRSEADWRAGRLKLLYVAPERFSNERFIEKLRRAKIALMVIDEAHCISEWGHNFRPDYLKLAGLSRSLGIERVLALTATATPAVANDICREFQIERDAYVHTGFYRPNLVLRTTPCRAGEQMDLLLSRLRSRPRGPTIVYVTLQRTAETVAAALTETDILARAYHAGMPNDERSAVQDWFMGSPDAIVVATIAFGMGIDKRDIRYVYHYNLPKSLENYSQEIGRAGRDGQESVCEILACGDDATVLENFTYGDTPEAASISGIVDGILGHEGEFDVSAYELSRAHDVRPLVVNTLLTYLELADVIDATAPFYSEYQFVPLKTTGEILARFDAERAGFLRGVFSSAIKAQKWFSIDLAETARRLLSKRERVVRALTYLEEQGDLTLKVAGLRQGYRVKRRPADVAKLKHNLTDRFATRECSDVNRVRRVIELTEHSGCIVRHLLSYFGEDLGRDCRHCDRCLGEPRGAISVTRTTKPPKLDQAKLADLCREHPQVLGSPRQMARFLCGLSSPLLTQAKLGKHPLFGSLAEIPFQEVMSATASCSTPSAL
ncbi:MAG: RecQ family ATP-dependent DNA helicase, partial [Chthoniobacterales bacterium]